MRSIEARLDQIEANQRELARKQDAVLAAIERAVQTSPAAGPVYLDSRAAAAMLGCSIGALHVRLSRDPGFPRQKLGRALRFDRDALLAWMRAQQQKAGDAEQAA